MAQDNNFTESMKFILKWEGGYVNHPKDPGGETKYGISKRAHPDLDIANLTVEQALDIYFREYWKASGCQQHPMPFATCVLNTAVMSGPRKAIALAESADSWDNYIYLFRVFLFNLNRPDFIKGWINRLNDLRKFCEIYEMDHPSGKS